MIADCHRHLQKKWNYVIRPSNELWCWSWHKYVRVFIFFIVLGGTKPVLWVTGICNVLQSHFFEFISKPGTCSALQKSWFHTRQLQLSCLRFWSTQNWKWYALCYYKKVVSVHRCRVECKVSFGKLQLLMSVVGAHTIHFWIAQLHRVDGIAM